MKNLVIVGLLIFGVILIGGKILKHPAGKSVVSKGLASVAQIEKTVTELGLFEGAAEPGTAKPLELKASTTSSENERPNKVKPEENPTLGTVTVSKEKTASSDKHETNIQAALSVDSEDQALTREAVISDTPSVSLASTSLEAEPVDFKRISEINQKYARVSELLGSFE